MVCRKGSGVRVRVRIGFGENQGCLRVTRDPRFMVDPAHTVHPLFHRNHDKVHEMLTW